MNNLIKMPAQLATKEHVSALIFGQPGIGKTTLGVSAPDTLLIDCDGGVHRIDPRHQTPTVQVTSYDDVLSVLDSDLTSFKTITFDTAGKLLDFMTEYIIRTDPKKGKRDGALTLEGYGTRKVMFTNLIRKIQMLRKNVIFIAHEREEKGAGDEKIIRPEIGGSSGADLIKELDLVGYVEAVGDKRSISFNPCEKFYAKNTCKLEPRYILPDTVSGDKPAPNNFMGSIIAHFKDGQDARQTMSNSYTDLIENVEQILLQSTEEDLNEVADTIKAMSHIWDSKLKAAQMLNERAKELNMKLNSKTKKYEPAKATV